MAFVAGLQDVVENHPWALAASVVLSSGTAAYLQSEHYKVRSPASVLHCIGLVFELRSNESLPIATPYSDRGSLVLASAQLHRGKEVL
jgi:hypothetical protein